jgi:hypothetical protein
LKTRSSAQADDMEIFEQDTKLARLNTGTVTPADRTRPELSDMGGGVAKKKNGLRTFS